MDKKMKRKEKMENASEKFWTGFASLFLLPIFVPERGWKEGIGKRFGYFLFIVVIFAALMFFVSIFKDKFLFQLTLAIASGLFAYHHGKEKSKGKKIWFFFLWLIYIIGVFYLNYFIDLFITSIIALIVIAFLNWWAEERTWKNIYPKYTIYITIAAIIIFLCLSIRSLFLDHEYYTNKQTISATVLRSEKESAAKLRSKIIPRAIPPGAKRKLPDHITGRDKILSSSPAKDWASSFFRNHQPAEFGRAKISVTNLFMAIYMLIALLHFLPVATEEKLGNLIKKAKEKRSKGEKGSKLEDIAAIGFSDTERIWNFFTGVLSMINAWRHGKKNK